MLVRDDVGVPTRRAAFVGAVVLGLLMTATGWVWAALVAQQVDDLATRTLGTRAAAIEDSTTAEVRRYVEALGLVAAALGTSSQVDATSFDSATAPLTSMALAGATSLAFLAPEVGDDAVSDLQSSWRRRGSTDLQLTPADGVNEHVFSVLSRPLDGSAQRRTGIDVSGATAPHEALMESQRSNEVTVSDAYELLIDQQLPPAQRQTSFTVTAPVLHDGRFVGWVLLGLRGQDFLGGVLESAAEGRVDVDLSADDVTGTDRTVARVATSGSTGTGEVRRRSTTVVVAQHTWVLEVAADTDVLVGPAGDRPLAIRIIAVVIGLLVAGLSWAVASSRHRAETEVRAATRDLALAEGKARRHATLLETMVETMDDVGVTVVDAEGQFLVNSRAARRILGLRTEPGDVVAPHQWQQVYGMFRVDGTPFPEADMPLLRALVGESTDDVEMLIRNPARPDGIRIAISGRPIALAGDRHGALAVFRDVTDERRREAELSAFAGMAAHDLKNPLALVRGCLELALADLPPLDPPLDVAPGAVAGTSTYLTKAASAAGRMAGLIDDLLAYSSADGSTLAVDEVDLGELVRDTLADVIAGHLAERRSAGVDVVHPLVHVGDLPVLRCDEERMRQVVGNLVGNALKYVEPGARPVIDVTAERLADGHGVRLMVADRGIGIPGDLRSEVVKPFVRTPTTSADAARYPGSGLGLAICQRIITSHGGRLRLRPNPGGGTVAVVDLPDAVSDIQPDTEPDTATLGIAPRDDKGPARGSEPADRARWSVS